MWNCGLFYHPLLPYPPLPPPPLSLLLPSHPPSLPRFGQVNFILALRLELLQEVEKLQKSLSVMCPILVKQLLISSYIK